MFGCSDVYHWMGRMVEAAHRNGELVAHFAAQSFTLREAKMMRV
jgi:hypothetical protein